MGSQGHVLELPKAGVFPWPNQLGKHLVAVHFWEQQGVISTGYHLPAPASAVWDPVATTSKLAQFGPMLHLLPQGSSVFPASCACLI